MSNVCKSEYKRIKAMAEERGDFVRNDDGYFVYWPKRSSRGYLDAGCLRILADILDEKNKAGDEQVHQELSKLPPKEGTDG